MDEDSIQNDEHSTTENGIVPVTTHTVPQIVDLVGDFKEYFYRERPQYLKKPMIWFVRQFDEEVARPMGRSFRPDTKVVNGWMKKWDKDLAKKLNLPVLSRNSNVEIEQIIKTRNEDMMLVPSDNELEGGLRTLGGELVNDALHMLKQDQELEEVHSPEALIKRRTYIVNVLNHATRLSQGKQALKLKEIEEKRNTTGFLMGLLSKASSGTMSDEELALLKTAYTPKTDG